jgi:DNA-binding XRE family transcriptional regulator
MHIGEKVKELREKRGLTQAALAYKAGIGQSYISKIEHQLINTPSAQALGGIADALGVELDTLMEGTTSLDFGQYICDGIGFCPHVGCPGGKYVGDGDEFWEPYRTPLINEHGEVNNYCQYCGTRLLTECWHCGRKIRKFAPYCANCGTPVFLPPRSYGNTEKQQYHDESHTPILHAGCSDDLRPEEGNH